MVRRLDPARRALAAAALAAVVVVPLAAGATTQAAITPGVDDNTSLGAPSSQQAVDGAGARMLDGTLTLITGDVVRRIALPTGEMRYATQPPSGGTGAYASYVDGDGDTHVIPASVNGLVGNRLDARLFNVTALFRDGYDDASRAELPLIVKHDGPLPSVSGLSYGVALTSIGATAAKLERSRAGEVGAQLARYAAARTLPYGIERIWLDGRVRASIDESVPQIGAPEAWAAGYDGTGMRIAILDTGIDDEHPDVAGQVVAARNFTFRGSVDDKSGHGTYVASIAAGTGARSDGQFVGVAYGADLINAKVLDASGYGDESSVIAGLEWAAGRQDADVINISANGEPTDGTDPMSLAVDAVSEAEDVLVVVSAGNEQYGSAPETIGTPASADAALAVGMVDKSDVVPEGYGARGPRLERFAIKPEIAAPGVAIAAAVIEDSPFGDPVQEGYTESSGSSAAAPHVAGAAALLRQARPDLSWSEIRSVLVTSAVDVGASVFAAGGGRVDVPNALAQTVHAAEPTANLGVLEWPHDDGETSTAVVTLINGGSAAVALDLSVKAQDEDGSPAADGLVTISDDQLSLAPGASGSVTITVDPAATDVVGLFSGFLVASADGVEALHVPLGFEVEPEAFDLTIELTDRSGGTDVYGSLGVVELTDDRFVMAEPVEGGIVELRVPRGRYGLTFQFFEGEAYDVVDVTEPDVDVAADTVVRLDARDTVEITAALPEPHAELADAAILTARGSRSGEAGYILWHESLGSEIQSRLFARPTTEVTTGSLEFVSSKSLNGTLRSYHLVFPEQGRIPDDLAYEVGPDNVATVEITMNRDVETLRYAADVMVYASYGLFGPAGLELDGRTTHEAWVPAGAAGYLVGIWNEGTSYLNFLQDSQVGLAPGTRLHQRWYGQPARPGMPWEDSIAGRADEFAAELFLMDADGQFGFPDEGFDGPAVDKIDFSLWSGGELVAESDYLFLGTEGIELPPELATYELRLDTARRADWWRMSTETSTVWQFESEAPPEGEAAAYPLLQVDYDVALDHLNRATAPATITFTSHAPGFEPGGPEEEITTFDSWTSTDDGETWSTLELTETTAGSYEGVLAPPQTCAAPCYVSIKVAAGNAAGTTIEQTITRAVTVIPANATPTLPPTGPGNSSPGLLGVALGLLVAGLLAVVLAARSRGRVPA